MNVSNRGYLYFVRLSGKIILLFCVFSYVYQIHYKIFPVTFSVILGLFGILYNFFINRGIFKIKWCNFYVFCGFYLVIISLIIIFSHKLSPIFFYYNYFLKRTV